MPRLNGLRRLMRIDRTRAGVERAVDDELQFHFDMTTRDLLAQGMSPDEARKEAERRFGDLQRTRERLATIDRARADQERRTEWWSAFFQDLRYALRGIRLKPGFAVAVVVTLGIGIGANATMFEIVDRLLFRPPNMLIAPDRATRLYLAHTFRGQEYTGTAMGYRRFLDLRERTSSFEAMTTFYTLKMATGTGETAREMSVGVSDEALWKMFDVKPMIGRFFAADENLPQGPSQVIVISYGYWQTQYGGRPDAVGTTVLLGPKKYTIIGVSPEGFNGFESDPLMGFVPIAAAAEGRGSAQDPWYSSYRMEWTGAFARRKRGVTPEAATTELTRAVRESYAKQFALQPSDRPGSTRGVSDMSIDVVRPHALAGPVLRDRGPEKSNDAKVATWLAGVAVIVLLIACANVANLLLSRALRRRREIAVRLALGVSRARLLMQLVTESLLLGAFGGGAALLMAQWGGAVVHRALLNQAFAAPLLTDPRVVSVVAALALTAGLLTGLAPALQAGRTDISAALKAGSREGTGTVRHSRVRVALLAGQAALSVVLLVGAGAFVRSLVNVQHVRLGFDSEQLLYVDPIWRGVQVDSAMQIALRDQLVERAKTVPGVENAARALTVPFWQNWTRSLYVEGVDPASKIGEVTSLQAGTPELFETMGTRILRGRGISRDDRANAPLAIVVNESMGKRLWPRQDPIGKCVRLDAETAPCRRVVGVAEDIRTNSISEPRMFYYLSSAQFNPTVGGMFVRTRGSATEKSETVRRALQPLMPGISYVSVTPMSTIMAPRTRSWRLGATMFAVFGMLALGLAAIGLYSVISCNVTQRMHEMGVRVALGAEGRDVVRLIVREGLTVVVPGIALGTVVALFGGRWLKPLLFDVSPADPAVLLAVVVTLIAVAILASWVPALRAARVDPNEALRAD